MTPRTERAIRLLLGLVLMQTLLLFGIFLFLSFEADWFAWLWTVGSMIYLFKRHLIKMLDEVEGK